MQKNQLVHNANLYLEKLPLEVLRARWSEMWGLDPHHRIGRTMLLRSLEHKVLEQEMRINSDLKQRLNQHIKSYKRDPHCFESNQPILKSGTRLIRDWNGKRYSILVQNSGYQYEEKIYGSLSQIASEITGTRWNGWVFFGLKKGAK